LGSQVLNATRTLDFPDWLDGLTRRSRIAYPAHAAVGTVLEVVHASPAATSMQWFKAAAHARSEPELERAAQGITDALARDDENDRARRTLCTVSALGNAGQNQVFDRLQLPCDRWPPNVLLEVDAVPNSVIVGAAVRITASATSASDFTGIVDVEIHNTEGEKVAQWVFSGQDLAAGQRCAYTIAWDVPDGLPPGMYAVELGVFSDGWGSVHGWKNSAQTIVITP